MFILSAKNREEEKKGNLTRSVLSWHRRSARVGYVGTVCSTPMEECASEQSNLVQTLHLLLTVVMVGLWM